jgi:RNA polymerase sigma factor (TIGR02999 family)
MKPGIGAAYNGEQVFPIMSEEVGSPRNITQLLHDWRAGDQQALNQLIPLVHQELHRIASRFMKNERRGHTLQTTAVVNEAYEKLVQHQQIQWQDRSHFFAIAAQIMRRILIDHARKRLSAKRPGARDKISLDEVALVSEPRAEELIALDHALTQLAALDPQKSRIVELKFFGGLTTQEIAETEQVSDTTIERQWRTAKAWLYRAIK